MKLFEFSPKPLLPLEQKIVMQNMTISIPDEHQYCTCKLISENATSYVTKKAASLPLQVGFSLNFQRSSNKTFSSTAGKCVTEACHLVVNPLRLHLILLYQLRKTCRKRRDQL